VSIKTNKGGINTIKKVGHLGRKKEGTKTIKSWALIQRKGGHQDNKTVGIRTSLNMRIKMIKALTFSTCEERIFLKN
jgi:hypothetical protein